MKTRPDILDVALDFLEGAGDAPATEGAAPSLTTQGFVGHPVGVRDGRIHAPNASVDREGFARLSSTESAVADFYDEADVRRTYYPEAAEVIAAMGDRRGLRAGDLPLGPDHHHPARRQGALPRPGDLHAQ